MSLPIFGDQVTEERGENARLSAFVGALAVGDLLKTTLGPKGMDKMLQSASKPNEMLITNDGATILQAIPFNNPAAKVLVNISKVQDEEVGDGTTTVAVFAVELLREAEKLIEKRIHPQTIVDGYQRARNTALEALERAATDRSANADAFREELMSIARTTLSSKILAEDKELFAKIAVDAVLRLKGDTNLEHIQVIKVPGGKLSDSYLDEGFLLEKKFGVGQPKRLENPKILVANTPMDTDKVKIFGAKFRVDSTAKLAELERAEKEKMKAKVNKILAHKCDLFVNRQLIYNWPEQLFCDAGVNTIEHADFVGIERLALVTGAEVVSTFDAPDKVKYGHCESVEEVSVGDKTMLRFNGVAKGQACSVILRGATEAVLGEAERALHDALSVLSQTVVDPRVVLGGGSAEMVMSRAVDLAANRDDGKRALAIEAFARALRQLPTILADNAGLDSSELVAKLRAAVYAGNNNAGLDLDQGCVVDSRENGTLESYKLKKSAVSSATEAATLLLRVDNIIRAKPRTADRNH